MAELKTPPAKFFRRHHVYLLFLLVLAIFCGPVQQVAAHADLVRVEPAPNSVLEAAPEQVSAWFTEPLESEFGEIRVLNNTGERVDNQDSNVDPLDPTRLTVSLPPLQNGTYTILWTNVSTVDGHKVRGYFLFSIGEPISIPDSIPTDLAPQLQSPLEPIWRWMVYLGSMGMIGGLFFYRFLLIPFRKKSEIRIANQEFWRLWGRRSRKIGRWSLILLLVGSVGQLFQQTAVTNDLAWWQVAGRPLLTTLQQTNWGRLWLLRVLFLFFLGIYQWRFDPFFNAVTREESGDRDFVMNNLSLSAGLGLLFCLALVSHAAGIGSARLAATFNDFFHLLGAVIWTGGLVHFTPGISLAQTRLQGSQRRKVLATLVKRFSVLGLIAVAVLGVSGLYAAWAQVTVLEALDTAYGRLLSVKTALLIPLLTIAAFNLFWIRPRLENKDNAGQSLLRLVSVEILVIFLIISVTSLLTALEPARQVASRLGLGREPLSFVAAVDEFNVNLLIEPGEVGLNRAEITLTDHENSRLADLEEVSLRLNYLESDLGSSIFVAERQEDGTFVAENVMFGLSGLWQVAITVRPSAGAPLRTAVRLTAVPAAAVNSAAIQPDASTGLLFWAAEWLLVALFFFCLLVFSRRRGKKIRRRLILPAIGALVVAVLLGFPARNWLLGSEEENVAAEVEATTLFNPFLPDMDSILAGQQVYEDHCMVCHGLTGHGDGPRAAGMDAVDIIEHVPLHADLDYFEIVASHRDRGDLVYSPGPVQTDDVWHLVNYLPVFEADQLRAEQLFIRARAAAEDEQPAQAMAILDQVINLSPRHLPAIQGRGLILMDQGEYALAIADFSRLLALNPENIETLLYRAEAYQFVNEWERALADYDEVLQLRPTLLAAYYERGFVRAEIGETAAAVADFEQYLELQPGTANRDLVETLITALKNDSIALNEAGLRLADLPFGFEPFPPEKMGLIPGSHLFAGIEVSDSFSFISENPFELIWGYTTVPLAAEEIAALDSTLRAEELLTFMASGLRAEAVLEWSYLAIPEAIWEQQVGVSAILAVPELEARVDGLAIQYGSSAVFIFVMTEKDTAPQSSVIDLAAKLTEKAAGN